MVVEKCDDKYMLLSMGKKKIQTKKSPCACNKRSFFKPRLQR